VLLTIQEKRVQKARLGIHVAQHQPHPTEILETIFALEIEGVEAVKFVANTCQTWIVAWFLKWNGAENRGNE